MLTFYGKKKGPLAGPNLGAVYQELKYVSSGNLHTKSIFAGRPTVDLDMFLQLWGKIECRIYIHL